MILDHDPKSLCQDSTANPVCYENPPALVPQESGSRFRVCHVMFFMTLVLATSPRLRLRAARSWCILVVVGKRYLSGLCQFGVLWPLG